MNPTTPDDADLERMLADRLDAEVQDVTAGPALLDRIKADAGTTTATHSRRSGRRSSRWLWPIAAAAAVVVAVALVTVGGSDDTDVATGENPDTAETQVVLSGVAGGEEWTVVEYVEDDPFFVDEPTRCLRFEPPIEDGPFFCGTEDDIVGAHGALVLRREARFNDHAVFAGVFASTVAEVTLRVDRGEGAVVEPTPWEGRDLGIAVVMLPVPSDVDFGVDLDDADGEWLSRGSSTVSEGTPGAEGPVTSGDESALVAALPEESRYVVTVDVDELKAALGVSGDHTFVPPASEVDQTLHVSVFSVLSHLRRPIDTGPAAAIDAALVARAAGNECAVGPECLTVLETRQDPDDLRRRFLEEGWSAEGGLLVNPGSVADVSYPVVGITPDLVFLGQDQTTVREAIEGQSTPPEQLASALGQVDGQVRRAVPCGDSAAAIASNPGVSHQIAGRGDTRVEEGATITVAGFDYLVDEITTSDDWTVVTIESSNAPARPLTHVADEDDASIVPAVVAATFAC